jgi:cytochrome P450
MQKAPESLFGTCSRFWVDRIQLRLWRCPERLHCPGRKRPSPTRRKASTPFSLHLATDENDRKRLVDGSALIPTAIEEFLRGYAPATVAREIVKETEIGGCPVKTGEMVLLSLSLS